MFSYIRPLPTRLSPRVSMPWSVPCLLLALGEAQRCGREYYGKIRLYVGNIASWFESTSHEFFFYRTFLRDVCVHCRHTIIWTRS